MDRAHPLGQTKQVTVYRLVVKGTVKERILQRAEEKSEVGVALVSCDANYVAYTVTIDTKDDNYWRRIQTRLTEAKRSSVTSLDDEEMEARCKYHVPLTSDKTTNMLLSTHSHGQAV